MRMLTLVLVLCADAGVVVPVGLDGDVPSPAVVTASSLAPQPPTVITVPRPSPVLKPEDAPTGELADRQLGRTVALLRDAVKRKDVALGAGLTLMLLAWFLRRRLPSLPKEWTPLGTLFLSAAPALASVLVVPGVTWDEVLVATATIWATANGAWAGAVKPLLRLVDRRGAASAPTGAPTPAPVDSPVPPDPPKT
jgi:hypothetical protein